MFSFKMLSWLTVGTVLVFAALVTLQALELHYYAQAPSVWPASP